MDQPSSRLLSIVASSHTAAACAAPVPSTAAAASPSVDPAPASAAAPARATAASDPDARPASGVAPRGLAEAATLTAGRVATLLGAGELRAAREVVLHGFAALRGATSVEAWRDVVVPAVRATALWPLVMQDPFCAHAVGKPRGYAGDALLIDFLYRADTVADRIAASTPLGRDLCELFMTSPAAAAVRARRDLFAGEIDAAAVGGRARVLSVACGHLREAAGSLAVRAGRAEIVGLDQDAASLAQAARELDAVPWGRAATLVHASIRDLVRGAPLPGTFDLAYAAGLFDYLRTDTARALTGRLWSLLAPGGTLVVSNFLPTCVNAASMELFQDWWLIYRTRAEIEACALGLEPRSLSHASYAEDPYACVGYLRLRKA